MNGVTHNNKDFVRLSIVTEKISLLSIQLYEYYLLPDLSDAPSVDKINENSNTGVVKRDDDDIEAAAGVGSGNHSNYGNPDNSDNPDHMGRVDSSNVTISPLSGEKTPPDLLRTGGIGEEGEEQRQPGALTTVNTLVSILPSTDASDKPADPTGQMGAAEGSETEGRSECWSHKVRFELDGRNSSGGLLNISFILTRCQGPPLFSPTSTPTAPPTLPPTLAPSIDAGIDIFSDPYMFIPTTESVSSSYQASGESRQDSPIPPPLSPESLIDSDRGDDEPTESAGGNRAMERELLSLTKRIPSLTLGSAKMKMPPPLLPPSHLHSPAADSDPANLAGLTLGGSSEGSESLSLSEEEGEGERVRMSHVTHVAPQPGRQYDPEEQLDTRHTLDSEQQENYRNKLVYFPPNSAARDRRDDNTALLSLVGELGIHVDPPLFSDPSPPGSHDDEEEKGLFGVGVDGNTAQQPQSLQHQQAAQRDEYLREWVENTKRKEFAQV